MCKSTSPAWCSRDNRALVEDQGGSAAVEFALLAPVLVLIVMGMIDFGSLMYQSMQVAAAAHAGAQYALRNGWDSSGILTAVTDATDLAVSATPAPQLLTACITNGVVVATVAKTCPSGGTPGNYVLVSAKSSVTPIVNWPSLVMPASVSSQATIRIN